MFNLTPTVRNLLFANIFFFAAQTYFLPLLTQVGSLYPIGSPMFYPWQFATCIFLHGSWMHLIFNMFGLISFGPLLEQRWGPQRFLVFWMICGIGASMLYQGVRYYEINKMEQARQEFRADPSGANFVEFFRQNFPDQQGYEQFGAAMTRNPKDPEYTNSATITLDTLVERSYSVGMLGASGALFGLLFAFAYLFPNTELFLLFIPFPIKAKYFVFFYAAYELYAGVHRTPGDSVAHFAHLGGLLVGFILVKLWEGGRERFY